MKNKEAIETKILWLKKQKALSIYGKGYVDALEWVLYEDYY